MHVHLLVPSSEQRLAGGCRGLGRGLLTRVKALSWEEGRHITSLLQANIESAEM